jgi:hypothetical protein
MLLGSRRRSFRALSGAAAVAAIVSGCAAPSLPNATSPSVPSQSSSSPAAIASEAAAATPTASPTATYSNVSPDLMAIEKETVLDVENRDGFKAKLSVTWHKVINLQEGDFSRFHNCLSRPPNFSPEAPRRVAARGAVVSVSAEFPNVEGFVWPKTDPLLVSSGGDGTVGVDPTFKCTDDGPALDGKSVQMTPGGRETVNFLVYEQEEITPKNPNGAFPDQDPVYSFRLNNKDATCSAPHCTIFNRP